LNDDRTMTFLLSTRRGTLNAIDHQRLYLDAVPQLVDTYGWDVIGGEEAGRLVVKLWGEVLDGLEHYAKTRDPSKLQGRVDWVNKEQLFMRVLRALNIDPDSPWTQRVSADKVGDAIEHMQRADLAYHRLDAEPFLVKIGVDRMLDWREITKAADEPPANTRAAGRSYAARTFARGSQVDWANVDVYYEEASSTGTDLALRNFDFPTPFMPTESDIEYALGRSPDPVKAMAILEDLSGRYVANQFRSGIARQAGRELPSQDFTIH